VTGNISSGILKKRSSENCRPKVDTRLGKRGRLRSGLFDSARHETAFQSCSKAYCASVETICNFSVSSSAWRDITWIHSPARTLYHSRDSTYVVKVKQVPEFELVAAQLRHDKTGAEHLHITREDKNNVFGIGFGTPSMNSSGIAHILVY
jgi:hypothetical protein